MDAMSEPTNDNVGSTADLNETQGLPPASAERRKKLGAKKQEKLLNSFKKKFKSWDDFEGGFIRQYKDDIRFSHGDSENMWQWDEALTASRVDKPSLTANMVRIHCALITNAVRRAPPSIMIKPIGLGATGASAKTIGGVVREISRVSNFTSILVKAAENLTQGGVGYWRVLTEFESERSFDQVIRIRSVADATAAGLDPSAKEPDGSDSNWGFIYEDIPNDEADELYPEMEDEIGVPNTVVAAKWGPLTWRNDKKTRVCEWYEREAYQDELVGFLGDDGQEKTEFASKVPVDLLAQLKRMRTTRVRNVVRRRIMWYKIVGDAIVDYEEVPGSFIPIVRVVGEEVVVDGVLDRKGLTRNLKDPQRNMNYWISSAAEQVALQTKVPYIGPKKAFENNPAWSSANTDNFAFLPFNDWDDENNRAIAAPVRPQQAQMADAYIKGLQLSEQLLKDISGQRANVDVQDDKGESGRAILARKATGELATYNFPDALAAGVAYTGKIILSMFPVVYDTPRVLRISNEDNTEAEIHIDPAAKQAQQTRQMEGDDAEAGDQQTVLNPTIGTYDVEATSGPDFETQRQWVVEAMSQVLAGNPDLWKVIGDLFVQNMDFPSANDMAERIRRTIPAAILGQGPSQSEQALQAKIAQMTKLLESLVQSNAELQTKLESKDDENTVRAVDAETRRIKEVGNSQENFEQAGLGTEFNALATQTIANAIDDPDPSLMAEQTDAENDIPDHMESSFQQPEPVQQGGAP